ncbi:MAG: hypothetical protein XD60_0855 [Acetothermia bacterium 64_32]|nr:MAG: hypothetical protein XD60_0855 [Acetothermia bacterium 64_32]
MSGGQSCPVCGRRLGERRCPALGGLICSVCCGTHRGRILQCPPSCSYLVAAERRRRERRAEELSKAWQEFTDLLIRRQMAPLIPYMEAAKKVLAQLIWEHPTTDYEVRESLLYAAGRLSPIELLEPVGPRLGELLEQVLLPAVQRGRVAPETLREALEGLAAFVEHFQREGEEDRFVAALLGTYPKEEPPGLILRP